MRIIKYEDKGKRTNIRCQHPTCKRKPFLRHLYYTDTGIIIGSKCKDKCENACMYGEKKKSSRIYKHPSQPSLIDLFKQPIEKEGVKPILLIMQQKKHVDEEFL